MHDLPTYLKVAFSCIGVVPLLIVTFIAGFVINGDEEVTMIVMFAEVFIAMMVFCGALIWGLWI